MSWVLGLLSRGLLAKSRPQSLEAAPGSIGGRGVGAAGNAYDDPDGGRLRPALGRRFVGAGEGVGGPGRR